MTKKQLLLLFLLVSVAVGNNAKASEDGDEPKQVGRLRRLLRRDKVDKAIKEEGCEQELSDVTKRLAACEKGTEERKAEMQNLYDKSERLEAEKKELSMSLQEKIAGLETSNTNLSDNVKRLQYGYHDQHGWQPGIEDAQDDRGDNHVGLRNQLAQTQADANKHKREVYKCKTDATTLNKKLNDLKTQLKNDTPESLRQQVAVENKRATELDNLNIQLNTKFNQINPHVFGTLEAGATYLLLSHFGGERTELLRKSVGDSFVLEGTSLGTAKHGGELHEWVSKRSDEEIKALGKGFKAGTVNVAGEVSNSLVLRWAWSKWFANRVETGNNSLAKLVRKSPECLKDLVRLAAVHLCWKGEKSLWF